MPRATRSCASSTDSHLDIDLDLLQQAHATTTRSSTCSTRTPARTTSRATPRHPASTAAHSPPSCSTHETESALLGALQEFPRIVAFAAELREPHRIARYLEELAGLYHRWYDNCRVIPLGDEPVDGRAPHPPLAQRRHRPGAAQRPGPAGRRRPRADVGDMTTAGATQPTEPIPKGWVSADAPAPRRRRAWPWIIAFAIVVALADRCVVRR